MRAPVLPDQDPATRTSLNPNQPLRVPVSTGRVEGQVGPQQRLGRTVRTRLALPAILPARRQLGFWSLSQMHASLVPEPGLGRSALTEGRSPASPRLASPSARCPQPSSSARCHLASSPDWGPWPG